MNTLLMKIPARIARLTLVGLVFALGLVVADAPQEYWWMLLAGLAVGGVVTADFLQATFTGFQALFTNEFAAVKPQWSRVAMEAPSTTDGETYNWLGAIPEMKEWKDTKVAAGLLANNYTIRNKDWEATIEVDRNTFDDDKLGIIEPRIRDLAQEAARHPDELISVLLLSNPNAYDGVAMFSASHTEGSSGTQSNLSAGTGTTTAQITADFRAARAAMINRKDDRGKPLIKNLGLEMGGGSPWLVMCPAGLLGAFEELMNASFIAQTENVLKGAFSLWVNPYLELLPGGDANDWYLFYIGSQVRAIIVQMRKRPVFVSLQDPNSTESVFFRKKYYFSAEARYNAGVGLWQYGHKVTN